MRRSAGHLGHVSTADEMNLANVLRVLQEYRDNLVEGGETLGDAKFRGVLLDDVQRPRHCLGPCRPHSPALHRPAHGVCGALPSAQSLSGAD